MTLRPAVSPLLVIVFLMSFIALPAFACEESTTEMDFVSSSTMKGQDYASDKKWRPAISIYAPLIKLLERRAKEDGCRLFALDELRNDYEEAGTAAANVGSVQLAARYLSLSKELWLKYAPASDEHGTRMANEHIDKIDKTMAKLLHR
jgi:hypothetical protein